MHWREGTTLVMLTKLLLWVCLLSLNQDIHWREGTTLVMLAKLLLWVCLLSALKGRYNIGNVGNFFYEYASVLSLNQDIHWREGTTLVMLATASMSMLTLFESRYTLKGRYSIGNVGNCFYEYASLNQAGDGTMTLVNVGKTVWLPRSLSSF